MLALILQAVQGANWQRAGGKGAAPQALKRPDDRPLQVRSADELTERRAAQRRALVARKAAKRRA